MNKMRVWNFGRGGKLVISIEVESMDEAAALASKWNKDPNTKPDMMIDIIANAPVPAHATKVRAVYATRRPVDESQTLLF